MRAESHAMLYELSSRALLLLMRVPALRSQLTWFSKVWLRHARVLKHLAEGSYDAIIDGGASIGEFAALARVACPRTPILCVEPHPPSAATLRRRGFEVVEAALWRETGVLDLVQPTHAVTSCTVAGDAPHSAPTWRVAATRLADLPVRGDNIFIKLDLQGAELQALEGMGSLWQRCGGLLLEVSYGEGGTYEPLRALLAEHGFYEAATFNELEADTRVIEADKLWLPRR
jgi:FkbM family methyltransferase